MGTKRAIITPSPTAWLRRPVRLMILAALLLAGVVPAAAWQPEVDAPLYGRRPETSSFAEQRSRALATLGVKNWHTLGYRGKGLKVAILDSSFTGYKALRGKSLPKQITVRSFRADGGLESRGNNHGSQCAEVIHAIVPEAQLLFATWEPDSPQRFLQAVRWARTQGARVISCSVIVPSWSDGEGGGAVHRQLAGELGDGNEPGDPLFFASAGNTAQRHWAGHFKASSTGWHQWSSGQTYNRVAPWGEERISVEVTCPAGGRFQLVVKDMKTGKQVAKARRVSGNDRFCLAVRFMPKRGRTYGVRVRELDPSPFGFHLSILGGNLQRATRVGSICFPGDGTSVLAVGAVDEDGRRQAYSSCGPNSLKPKPELVAVVPFPLPRRKEPFTGTSAAAPQAAGAAALLWSTQKAWRAAQVRKALLSNAVQLDGSNEHSYDTGFGLVRLPNLSRPAEAEDSADEENE